MKPSKFISVAILIFPVFLVSSCGGSGGGGGNESSDESNEEYTTTTVLRSLHPIATGSAQDNDPVVTLDIYNTPQATFDLFNTYPNDTIFYNYGSSESRIALEFNLFQYPEIALQMNKQIVSATLYVCIEFFDPGDNLWEMEIHGFQGDGMLQLSDFGVDNELGSEFAIGGITLLSFDVTDYVKQVEKSIGFFVGFNMRQVFSPGNPDVLLRTSDLCTLDGFPFPVSSELVTEFL